ncbi:procollagen-lysine,2-oxoglutarate 5-dioxygenase isoform X1 [Halyomorpha halys]|uniref:procollagen-lysine,2-oxoglutarate 5-dioxygenase isoform X1 n=1 Tax=Halyomorpha halys TaxID=286706 RepID=UPI0006D4EB5F|nr:procollagen-lysine,2-oxoglutarate 5-dioxygenase 1 isoform X2 [Halyomorpha halys]
MDLLIKLAGLFMLASAEYCFVSNGCKETLSYKESMIADLIIFTVSTNETDGFKRFMQSVEAYDLSVKVLGMGEKWEGGDMRYRGGGYKINLLKHALKPYQHDDSLLVMFTDSFDVIFLGTKENIIQNFKTFNASIVFAAEVFCWPDKSLADSYPKTELPYKYLNSGGFIGYAKQLYNLLEENRLKNKDDDQHYFTKLFLDKQIREKYRIRLDNKATIFQCASGATDHLKLIESSDNYYALLNEVTGSQPLVLHGNGPSKLYLNAVGNYLSKARSSSSNDCLNCPSINIPYVGEFPVLLMGIFIPFDTPFMEEFFEKINQLKYPKNKIHLYIYSKVESHTSIINKFISENKEYLSVKKIEANEGIDESLARNLAIERCKIKNCKFFFSVDSVVHLDDPTVLQWLIQEQRGIVGPMLLRPYRSWSNFWGALNNEGYYARSFDYMDIINGDKRGVWNIPYLTSCYLVNATLLPLISGAYENGKLDSDMAFCQTLRDKEIFMFVDNRIDVGHLINPEDFDSTKVNPEMYEIFTNKFDWEQRYIHPNFSMSLRDDVTPIQPCPDVYWFPIVTPRFCKELIEMVENHGKWSSGSNYDERLAGGYENVPTRDIHMKQIDFERHWLYFLQQYVRLLQERVFIGYFHDPPQALMNFVVRYRPDEQPSLRPHHDSSTYTVNIALNRRGIDYEGGGCRFIRYNCSITDTKVGWLLLHPGRLTHFHEGLLVSKGTRYIMVSFVDP